MVLDQMTGKLACALGSLSQSLATDRTFKDRSSDMTMRLRHCSVLCLWGQKPLSHLQHLVPKSRSSPWRWQDVFSSKPPLHVPDPHLHWSGFSTFTYLHWRAGLSRSAMYHSLWPYGLYPGRPLCPWNSPGKNTRVGCHALLQGIFPTQGSNPGLLHCRQILYHLNH